MQKNIQGVEGFDLMEIHNIMVENSPFKGEQWLVLIFIQKKLKNIQKPIDNCI